MSYVIHRPFGLGHPYAASADQRLPVLPLAGETCRLGVTTTPEVSAVVCEWDDGSEIAELPLAPFETDAADKAALSGGEGHLAEAQASMLAADGAWAVTSPPLEAGVRYRYRFAAQVGAYTERTPWYEVAAATWTSEPRGALTGADARLVTGSTAWLASADGVHRARFSLRLRPGDHVVGFGERFDRLDQAGHRLDAVVFEQYKSQGEHGRTYLPMPFAHVVGTDGSSWGFHVRTSRRVWFDVAASSPDTLVVEVALGGTDDERVDVALYDGSPTEVLRSFLDEVGRAEQLPDWVFRLWASGNEWNTQQLVLDRMDAHDELDIPVGVVVIEAWSDEEGITIFRDAEYAVNEDGGAHDAADFSYSAAGAWPDPQAMIDELHARGIKVVLWQIPLQKTDPELVGQVRVDATAMVREGHAVLEADGTPYHNRGWWFPRALMADLSAQRTRDWWAEKRRYLVRDLGVDGFKTDGGEHAWGHDLRYADGRRGDEGNNLFPVHYARTFGDLLRSEGKAPVTFSRAGFTGSQAHGIFWAGDESSTWQAFRNSIVAGLTAASCGIVYWGWDIAGFSGPVPDAELYLRATAASVFMPVMQYHSEYHHHVPPLRDRTPWNVAETSGDERVIPLFRRFATMRERLVPYLATQAAKTTSTDHPLMRPLFFDYPDDARVWEHASQWHLGDDLLVNPVTADGATTWTTYLPDGEWVDPWTGRRHFGGTTVGTDVPLDKIPVFVRAHAWPDLRTVFLSAD